MAKMPAYRLQALFDIRERAKKAAEDAYAKEQKKLIVEKNQLKKMENTLEEMKQLREQKKAEYAEAMNSSTLTIEKIQINNRHIDLLVQKEKDFVIEIDKQKEVVVAAQKLVDEALQKMLDATQEYKALEKHRDKWLKETKNEMEKKEEDAIGDITQAQYFAHKRENES